MSVGSYADYGDVLDSLAAAAFLDGSQPFSRTRRLQRVRRDASLIPAGATSRRTADVHGDTTTVATGDGWTVHRWRGRDGSVLLTVTAATADLLARLFEEITTDVEEPAPPRDEAVTMGFWHLARCGPSKSPRRVAVTPWGEIRRNYSKRVAAAMTRVMALGPDDLTGRLLLFHGPPGTGKTTALRSLAHAWQSWCDVDYVLDPERLLDEPSYLLAVIMGMDRADTDTDDEDGDRGGDGGDGDGDGRPKSPPRWRLLVLEDCDELVQADAKRRTGQALGRLLNLTDGLLGHGLRLLVGLTTNEPLSTLHPAVVRPGRCVAQVEVGRLSPAEARAWLGRAAPVDAAGLTLAELFALQGQLTTVEELAPAAVGGLYL